jgi:hexosaminidase
MTGYATIPQPVSLNPQEGNFSFTPQTKVISTTAPDVAKIFCDWTNPATGFNLQPVYHSTGVSETITFELDENIPVPGKEGYLLSVSPSKVIARARTSHGLLHAIQTIRQLLPYQIFSPTVSSEMKWEIPCVEIEDYPRFGWRGFMLDVGRHFMPLPNIYKYLDLLSLHKMNSFHWHLTDDQGWRIEIKKYPRLTEIGAWRRHTMVGHYSENVEKETYDGIRHGGYYTQDELRQVVAYAASLGINIVPEIEMPGHAQAAIAAYPELGNIDSPIEVSTGWGIHEHVYNVDESTIRVMQDILDEVISIFPSPFIHIGGDEVPKKEWKASPKAQQRMAELGLANEDELQSYFVRRMDSFLTARGRRLIGWDEILEGGLAPNATVMSWRGIAGGIAAAQAGHDVVMAPNSHTYLDYCQSQDQASEPLGIGGYLPLEQVYQFNPIPEALNPEQTHHILGAQGQLWTEYISTPEKAEYMTLPRLCAIAEVAWSPDEKKDYANFLQRLQIHQQRFDALGLNYRR